MAIGRRDVMLGAVGLGVTLAAGPRLLSAGDSVAPRDFNTYRSMPGDGTDQTAALQAAFDVAAGSGTQLFLAPGIYSTSRLELKSGTHLLGITGKSILRYREGGAVLSAHRAQDIRIEGLVLDGGGRALGQEGALLGALEVERLELSNCRFVGASANGVALKRGSARIANCHFVDMRRTALISEDSSTVEIAHNHIHACGDHGILVRVTDPGEAMIANNIVDEAATGIAVRSFSEGGLAVVRGNFVRNLSFRKCAPSSGTGISIEAGAWVSGNVVDNASGFGILVGRGEATVTDNRLRNVYVGIGIPANRSAGTALMTGNAIVGAKDGAIRAVGGTGADRPRSRRLHQPRPLTADNYRPKGTYSRIAGTAPPT